MSSAMVSAVPDTQASDPSPSTGAAPESKATAIAALIDAIRSSGAGTDYAALVHEASAFIDGEDDEALLLQAYRARFMAREGQLLQPFNDSEDELDLALHRLDPKVNYGRVVALLERMISDLEHASELLTAGSLEATIDERYEQLERARQRADELTARRHRPAPTVPPKALAPSSTPTPSSTPPQETAANAANLVDSRTANAIENPRPDALAIGLGGSFLAAGTAAAGASVVGMRQVIFQKEGSQEPSSAHLAAGVSAAIASGLLIGGGTRMLANEAISRDPQRARPLRQASWALLATTGGLAAASLTLSVAGRDQWNAAREEYISTRDGKPDYEDSNLSFNRALVLAGLAASQLGAFVGMRSATGPKARPGQRARRASPSIALRQRGLGMALTIGW